MADYYLKALFGAHIGANIISMPITELEIDTIKEVISRSCESVIDHDMLSDHEKEEQKRQMKQILEFFIHGIKDGLRYEGKLGYCKNMSPKVKMPIFTLSIPVI